ncbi:MAG TPA: hypothetical protein VN616_08585 [Puia sp.]|nr:hypothetical protein [Puia sp.]
MKRLYARITGGTMTEPEEEAMPTGTGLLAAFLCGVLFCMFVHWLLF